MWQNSNRPVQDPFMGLLMPLLKSGIPVCSVPVERSADQAYMRNFRLLVLSYQAWKPELAQYHDNIAGWVRNGGTLIVLDGKDAFNGINMFWKQQGYGSPRAHLLSKFGIASYFVGDNVKEGGVSYYHKAVGGGHVVVSKLSPKTFVDDTTAEGKYLPLVRTCFEKYLGRELDEAGLLTAKRGDFLIVHTFGRAKTIDGIFIDIFHENLPVIESPYLAQDSSHILFDISNKVSGTTLRVLYTTYRLMGKKELAKETAFFIAGPTGTEGRARLYGGGSKIDSISAFTSAGRAVGTDFTESLDGTVLVKFPYNAHGIAVKIAWK